MRSAGVLVAGWCLLVAGCAESDTSAQPSESSSAQSLSLPPSPSDAGSPPSQKPTNSKSKQTNVGLPEEYDLLADDGYLELRLGMTPQQAEQTGRLQLDPKVGLCQGLWLAMYGDAAGLSAHGYFTDGRGLSVIYGQGGDMRTAEGVTSGTSASELRDAYPDLREAEDGLLKARVTETTELFFRLDAKDLVRDYGVALVDDPCTARGLPEVSSPTA